MYDEYWAILGPAIPGDVAEQYTSRRLVQKVIGSRKSLEVLDLGAGDGRAVDFFRKIDNSLKYFGVDIETSPEVSTRIRRDVEFQSFDGIHLPYENSAFDIVFCNQVFEHVASPAELLADIRRVLKPEGYFVGSVSQLEPYHSYSFWNFTIYGFAKLLSASGLKLEELRPGIDGPTLIMRSVNKRHERYSKYFSGLSPLNGRLIRQGVAQGMSPKQINHRMLQYAGHICFSAKPIFYEKRETHSAIGPKI